jgi:cell cycle protein kinase DBF2
MSNFISNLFPSSQGGKHDGITDIPPPPPLQSRHSNDRPNTPIRNNNNNFTTPSQTPQGSPSKKTLPPGANDLPIAFENAMKLTSSTFGSPTKIGRPQIGTPLSPTKGNALADDSYFSTSSSGNVDESIYKSGVSPGSPLRKEGQENTPPTSRGQDAAPNQAAISRQELYQPREQQTTKKYNTQRGLTSEELEILNKPNVKRLANVTQLCKLH